MSLTVYIIVPLILGSLYFVSSAIPPSTTPPMPSLPPSDTPPFPPLPSSDTPYMLPSDTPPMPPLPPSNTTPHILSSDTPPMPPLPPSDCYYNGQPYNSGDRFQHGPCELCECVVDQVTCTHIDCFFTPCVAPRPPLPGQCCPTCPDGEDCQAPDGKVLKINETHMPDSNTICQCPHDASGIISNVAKCTSVNSSTTPTLTSPPVTSSLTSPGDRYPLHVSTPFPVPPEVCFYTADRIYDAGQTFQISACESCTCEMGGQIYCTRTACPALPCVDRLQEPNKCCPSCPNGRNCRGPGGHILKHNETYWPDSLTVCRCPEHHVGVLGNVALCVAS